MLATAPVLQAGVDLEPIWTRLGDDAPGAKIDVDNQSCSVESVEFSPDGELILAGSKGVEQKGGGRLGQRVTLWNRDGELLWKLDRHDEIEVVAFSRDGARFVIGLDDGTMEAYRIRREAGGALLRDADGSLTPELEQSWKVRQCDGLRFSHDGQLLAMGDDNHLQIYRTSDWRRLADVDNGSYGVKWAAINSVDWTADDRRIVVAGGGDENVRIWGVTRTDTDDGLVVELESLCEFRFPDDTTCKSVRFNPADETIIASGWYGGKVRVFDFASDDYAHAEVEQRLIDTGKNGTMETVEFSPDGRYLLTGGAEGKKTHAGMGNLRIYDVQSDFNLVKTVPVFRQEYLHFHVDKDTGSALLVSGHEDGALRLWRLVEE